MPSVNAPDKKDLVPRQPTGQPVRRLALPLSGVLCVAGCGSATLVAEAEAPLHRSESVPLSSVPAPLRLAYFRSLPSHPVAGALSWTEQTKLTALDGTTKDNFGMSVFVDGDTAVVGAFRKAVAGQPEQGQAYIYVRSSGIWSEQARLMASDGAAYDNFGISVALSGDTAIVGAPGKDFAGLLNRGQVYVYVRSSGTWTEQAKLTASDGGASDNFGAVTAVNGNTVLIGVPHKAVGGRRAQGQAYVYVRSGAAWAEQAKLVAADSEADALFGSSAAVDADTAVVTSPGKDIGPDSGRGQAYVYVRAGSAWSEQAKLTASDGVANDLFGNSVSISGDTAIVGTRSRGVMSGRGFQGEAYVYTRASGAWSEQVKLIASDSTANDGFGASVSVSGDTAVVGAPTKEMGGSKNQGGTYLYVRSGSSWSERAKLAASDGAAEDRFGYSVSLSGSLAIVGAVGKSVGGLASQGQAYVFAVPMPLPNGAACTEDEACTSGHCADGVCCNTGCGGSALDCQACSTLAGAPADGTCAAVSAGTECRRAVGPCDIAETCDGSSSICPGDAFLSTAIECRPAVGTCDQAERCTGTSAACPADSERPDGTVCAGGTCASGLCRLESDLGVTVSPHRRKLGFEEAAAFAVQVHNNGPSPATSVKLALVLPSNASFRGAAGDGWICQSDVRGASCVRTRLSAGRAPLLTVIVRPPPDEQSLAVAIQTRAAEFDPNLVNNDARAQVEIDEMPAASGGACSLVGGRASGASGSALCALLGLLGLLRLSRRRISLLSRAISCSNFKRLRTIK